MANLVDVQLAAGGNPVAQNFHKKFRDPFVSWPNENWETDRQASGDAILVDGNSAGASYLSVALSPLAAGTETWIESVDSYTMPVELAVGAHMSQRTLGQEFSIEVVSTETPVALPVSGVNYNRNGYGAGAVTGTPGTAPTNWSVSPVAGLTSTITDLGVGVIDGVNVKLTRFDITGTAGATGDVTLFPESTTLIVAAEGQTWTTSAYIYGTSTHAVKHVLRCGDSGGASTAFISGELFSVPATAIRTSFTGILTNALTTRVLGRPQFPVLNGDTVNISVVYALPQMELGSVVSAPTATVGTAITSPTTDLVIASISQATTTLSVTTAQSHGLRAGDRIGINSVSDSRLNYPALVVATTPTATTFTATAGPGGTIPSVTAGPFTNGLVHFRSAMGRARNGTSMIFENATVTQGSIYTKSDAGDATPIGGTITGQHVVTLGTTASIQAINAALNYAFRPTTEYRLALLSDKLQWSDVTVADNTLSQSTSRAAGAQVIPNPDKNYKIRIRATNNEGLTVPICHIQSVAKTGTTTATVTTQTPHGLTTGDYIAAYGVRDTTNFANLTAATVVASVIDANNFTVIWGSAVTATSQAGVIYRVNGGNLPSALGAIAQVAQSVSRTSNILTVVGSAAWAGLLIGDYVDLAAFHDTGGTDLLLDGAYRVRDIQTTSLFLEPIVTSIGTYAPTGTDITSTNCGGAVIKRTVLRVSWMRLFDFERQRVELLNRPSGDIASAAPVVLQNSPAVTISSGTVTTVSTVTAVTTAGTPPVPATPYFVNSAASTNGALILTGTSGLQNVWATNTGAGAAFVKLYNKATAPTVGTDVPEMIVPVPAAAAGVPGVANVNCGYIGLRFPLGLGIAITGAVADSDTTAVAAGQVKVKLSRTV